MAQVTIERAVTNALKAWLEHGLTGVTVSSRWPEPSTALPLKSITILRAGGPRESSHQPELVGYDEIHAGLSAAVEPDGDPVALLNACRASYEAHRVSTDAHRAADSVNAVTAPVATNLTTAAALATNLEQKLAAHVAATTPHATLDTESAGRLLTGSAPLAARAEAIRLCLAQHYAARIYVWRTAHCEQDLQLDVWTTYDAVREDIDARLVDLLHASPARTAPTLAALHTDARNGILLALGDGWHGTDWQATADVEFEQPVTSDSTASTQRNEYRTTYRGRAVYPRLVRQQGSRLVRTRLRLTLPPSTATLTATVAASASGTAVTITEE